ncbi:hypothetical protein ROHU_008276 [Labeo rohita]|uniref:Uncharacterized protein n=1 Tax=Labeo rohita TaxID=84645 RepID=A0A498M9X0_LABRO|nr:hypothetical protein ROHU_008276 [Labeo rohita]
MLILLGKISCSINNSEITNLTNRKEQTSHQRQRTYYWLEGKQLCRETFKFLHISLCKLGDKHSEWDKHLDAVMFELRTKRQMSKSQPLAPLSHPPKVPKAPTKASLSGAAKVCFHFAKYMVPLH